MSLLVVHSQLYPDSLWVKNNLTRLRIWLDDSNAWISAIDLENQSIWAQMIGLWFIEGKNAQTGDPEELTPLFARPALSLGFANARVALQLKKPSFKKKGATMPGFDLVSISNFKSENATWKENQITFKKTAVQVEIVCNGGR